MPWETTSILDQPLAYERVRRFSGMNGYERPTLLPDDICARMVNRLVTDNGACKTRPGFDSLGAPFSPNLIPGPATYNGSGYYQAAVLTAGQRYYWTKTADDIYLENGGESLYASGYFTAQSTLLQLNGTPTTPLTCTVRAAEYSAYPIQGLCFHYRLASQRLVAVINRNWYEWDGSAWSAAVSGWQAVNATRAVSIAQLNAKLYVADGSQRIFEYDSTGPTFTELSGPNDPPAAASILVAHAGRVFAAGWTDGVTAPNVIRASNLRAAGTGSWDAVNFETVLTPDYAPVKAMVSMQRNWLAVLHENSIHMMETSPLASTAADWNKQEISRELGCVGPRAALNVAGDCWFWSADGLRSIKGAVGTEGAFEIVNPLSQPLQELVERVNPLAVAKIAMHRYKEFVFIDVPLDSATENDHTLVFNVRLGQWMGYWTGCAATIRTTTYFSGAPNQMVAGLSTARVVQWKDTEDQDDTTTYQDDGLDIPTTLRLKSWDFQEPESAKSGDFYVLWFDAAFAVNCSVAVAYDTDEQRVDTIEEDEAQNSLPLSLPFDLADERYRRAVRHLDSLGDFHEMYLEITTTAGNCVLVAATCAAFVQSVRDK
jgi:hypothetical protein